MPATPENALIPGVFLRKPEGAFYFVARLPIEDGEDEPAPRGRPRRLPPRGLTTTAKRFAVITVTPGRKSIRATNQPVGALGARPAHAQSIFQREILVEGISNRFQSRHRGFSQDGGEGVGGHGKGEIASVQQTLPGSGIRQ